ncbi:MerR family DNA-binding transcriptional regulator [Actinomyces viscosus]|uniref:MerR family regulatory protein n=2 Tax=Actinomyces viscosus TaxID=1656 RepID=A0A3S4V8E1_ACTVI|nr:MerR family DNA-binding transcriptional regulator [Actinomyces viscosus]VEI14256.1 MerR family regulatory protein [Actinomyces viscosus]
MVMPVAADQERTYGIGEASQATGLTTSALRFYDREDLPPRIRRIKEACGIHRY